jgi:nucleoid-associated protein YgaU
MQKDFKIGLAVGLLFVIGVALWLSTLPGLSTKSRALRAASAEAPNERPVATEVEPSRRGEGQSAYNPPAFPQQVSAEPQTPKNEPAGKIHIVQKGDTLSAISAKYYGSPLHWQRILTANHASLPDPNRLIPGSRLIIPE